MDVGLVLPQRLGQIHSLLFILIKTLYSHTFYNNCSDILLGQTVGQTDFMGHFTRKELIMPEPSNLPKSTEQSRSWFAVLNNPEKLDCFSDLSPEDIVKKAITMWCENKPQRSCAINYEIGDSGTPHLHMVLEDPAKTRFSAVQKLYPGIHIEPTRGNKQQAEDYIEKRGKFAEKGHTIIVPAQYNGTITAQQGRRNDLKDIELLILAGLTPNQIMDLSIEYRAYETLIRKAFFAKRSKETPIKRDVRVFWHVGESGTGKSYTYVNLCQQFGEDNVYLLTDYDIGGFDLYCGEPILFMDEFKGTMKFQQLLNYLDCYKVQIHCRYANSYSLWNEVHITSVYPPDEVYSFMVESSRQERDRISQLLRRLNQIVYHYRDESGHYLHVSIPACEYSNYKDLRQRVYHPDGFIPVGKSPFNT